MIISFLGDSITMGVGASQPEKCYVSLVGKTLDYTVLNYGMSGTRIARRKQMYNHTADIDFGLRVPLIEKNSDLVFVFGGTNDYGHGDASLGDFNGKDVYTFNGALRSLIDSLIVKFGKEKIRFIIPCHRYNENNKAPYLEEVLTLKDFVDAEIKMLKEYQIPYLDLYNDWVGEPATNLDEGCFIDGLHPNDFGHESIAEKVCKFIKQNP